MLRATKSRNTGKTYLQTLFFLLLATQICFAQWSTDPELNNPICTADGVQYNVAITDDRNSGAIIAWEDGRNGQTDIYTQRINFNGEIQWQPNGVAICTAPSGQGCPAIISDGNGGAIITWFDYRNAWNNSDIYAQRINSNGLVQWATDGVVICEATGYQRNASLITDGSGGAIITWADYRNQNAGIYAQHIDSSGLVKWMTDGIYIGLAPTLYTHPTLVSDGLKGAIITWLAAYGLNIYAQRVDSLGIVLWNAGGVLICEGTNDLIEPDPHIIPDEAGGAIITWPDTRTAESDIYAQRINSNGLVLWKENGLPICCAPQWQSGVSIICDDSGGAIIVWSDGRMWNNAIYVQRVDPNGNVQFTADGVSIYTSGGYLGPPAIIKDGNGGAIITIWDDYHTIIDGNLYAQRINFNGEIKWPACGAAISTAPNNQHSAVLISDGYSGAIITWMDYRGGGFEYCDIYASQVDSNGNLGNPIPVELVSFTATTNSIGVILNWLTATETNNQGFEVQRDNGRDFEALAFIDGHGTTTELHAYSHTDRNVEDGSYRYRLKQVDFDGAFEYSNVVEVDISAPDVFALDQNYPNPFNPSTTFRYSIPQTSKVQIKVFDVLGNEIGTLVNEKKPAGTYNVEFTINNLQLSSGVYFYQLKVYPANGGAGSFVETKKMILLK